MYYITGDIHRDYERLARACSEHGLTSRDTVILLGDTGINYYGDKRDSELKARLSGIAASILCIHGNHDRRPRSIGTYRQSPWQGGLVDLEDAFPNILFARDGEVYDLGGLRAIAIGGAYSPDKHARLLLGWNWFADEQPDQPIKDYVESQLASHDWSVDVVLSHTCPHKYRPVEVFGEGFDRDLIDESTELWLDEIESKLSYRRWYCGHFHIEKRVDRMQFMFEGFEPLVSPLVSPSQ